MFELFQNWGFLEVFIAVLFGITSAVWVLKERSQNKKNLQYTVLYNTSLVNVREEAKERIQILFDEKIVTDASLSVIKISNQGRIPISPEDFKEPISISLGDKAKVLSVDITDREPDNLNTPIAINENKVQIQPILFNKNDSITLSIISSKPSEDINITSRIIGVQEIKNMGTEKSLRPYITGAVIAALVITLIFIIVSSFEDVLATPTTSYVVYVRTSESEPIQGARLAVIYEGKTLYSAYTDAYGYAKIMIPTSQGEIFYQFVVEADGYATYKDVSSLIHNTRYVYNIRLQTVP